MEHVIVDNIQHRPTTKSTHASVRVTRFIIGNKHIDITITTCEDVASDSGAD